MLLKNMRFISCAFCLVLLLNSCGNSKDPYPTPGDFPPYGFIIEFSKKIGPGTGLILRSYGINRGVPKNYQPIHGVASFSAGFSLSKKREDEISLDAARNLIVFLVDNFVNEINSTKEIIPWLDTYPYTNNLLDITLYFEDERRIDLGQGVAIVYFRKGEIEYEGYRIDEYTGRYPANGEHFTIHKETYAEALEIVKKQDLSMQ